MVELHVEGMTCGGCAASVKRAVQTVDRDANVDVDLQQKIVRIESQADVEAVKTAIIDAGYPVAG